MTKGRVQGQSPGLERSNPEPAKGPSSIRKMRPLERPGRLPDAVVAQPNESLPPPRAESEYKEYRCVNSWYGPSVEGVSNDETRHTGFSGDDSPPHMGEVNGDLIHQDFSEVMSAFISDEEHDFCHHDVFTGNDHTAGGDQSCLEENPVIDPIFML